MSKLTGYLIEKYSNMLGSYTCNRLVEEAGILGIQLDIIGNHDIFVKNDGIYCKGSLLNPRDFVINRYKWGKIKSEVNGLVKRCYNNQLQFETYVNKYAQMKQLHSEQFEMPKYMLATVAADFKTLGGYLGIPFVVKGLESSQGEEVYLVTKESELSSIRKKFSEEKELLFEEYIDTSFGRDMRIYSVRGNVIASMIRESKGDFRANVALGARTEAFEATPEILCIAKDIYKQTGLDFLGIDLLFGTQKPVFCEINVMPGIEGMEKATGVNIGRKIMETIKGDFINE